MGLRFGEGVWSCGRVAQGATGTAGESSAVRGKPDYFRTAGFNLRNNDKAFLI